jgi:hypothetical protein
MNTTLPYNVGSRFAGQQFDWLPTDSEETYQQMIQDPAHRQYFAEQGWDKPGAITYKINSHGFRCDEFDGGPYVLTLGCSFTLGTGLPVQDTWPSLIGRELGLKVANISWGGNSADTCFRMGEYWIPELKPELVIMLTPPRHRFELLLDFDSVKHLQALPLEVFMPNVSLGIFNDDNYVKHWFLNEENSRLNKIKNEMAVRQLCRENNIPCMVFDSIEAFGKSREEIGYARDYMHAGSLGHRILVERMINEYRTKS